jgi:uncharacterized OsmC-like protein
MATRRKERPLNGLDLTALSGMVEAIGQDKKNAKASFSVTTHWAGQARSETFVETIALGDEEIRCAHRISADEPEQLLGTGSAPNPQQLLLAAFNACLVVGYVAGASLRGIELESVEIETRGELDLRGFLAMRDDVPPGHRALDYAVRIKGDGTADQFAEIHRSVMATSPNYFSICRPLRVNGTLSVG